MATSNKPQNSSANFKRLLTRAEASILFGMICCVFSLFMTWPLPITDKLLPGAIQVIKWTRQGAPSEAHWSILISSLVTGAMLAVPLNPSTRIPIIVVQGMCGLVCFAMGIKFLTGQPGPIIDLIGGALLTFGAIDRFFGVTKPK